MKTLIVLNGVCNDILFLKSLSEKFDKVVCADGGYLHAVSAGVVANMVVGDFDSSELPTEIGSVVFPKEKDLSDAEIAIEYARKNYGDDITLTCSLGNRFDHQLFNVFLLAKYPNLIIEEPDAIIFLCKANNDFSEFNGKTVSFFPIEKANITLQNFKYNLFQQDIQQGNTVTLSNIVLDNAVVNVNSGKVIAIINKNNL